MSKNTIIQVSDDMKLICILFHIKKSVGITTKKKNEPNKKHYTVQIMHT